MAWHTWPLPPTLRHLTLEFEVFDAPTFDFARCHLRHLSKLETLLVTTYYPPSETSARAFIVPLLDSLT